MAEEKQCDSCDILRSLLDDERIANEKLIKQVIELSDSKKTLPPAVIEQEVPLEQIRKGPIPWRVQRQMLEENDRVAAKILKEKAEEIAELEKELGVADK